MTQRLRSLPRPWLWIAGAIALLVVLTAGLTVALWPDPELPDGCAEAIDTRDEQLSEPVTSGDRTIAVLGDSYTQGPGLPGGPDDAWPAALGARLGAEVVVDGVGSTGFTTAGLCAPAEITYGQRLEADPPDADVVVVQGGVNDAILGRPDEVAAAAADLLGELADVPTVVVVGPTSAPAADPSKVSTVDDALRKATEDAGRVYVPLRDAGIELLDDQLHPTVPGQQRIAELVAAAIEAAGRQR